MESIEFKRYSKQLQNLLLKIFSEKIEDPMFKRLTINYLKLDKTRRIATVYLDLMSIKDTQLVLKKLNRLNSLFREFLGEYLNKYKIPKLRFVEDKVLNDGFRVEKLIKESL